MLLLCRPSCHIGANFELTWWQLGDNLGALGPTWSQGGPGVGCLGPHFAHLGANLAPTWAILGPSWRQLGAFLALTYAILGLTWALSSPVLVNKGPAWGQLNLTWAHLMQL